MHACTSTTVATRRRARCRSSRWRTGSTLSGKSGPGTWTQACSRESTRCVLRYERRAWHLSITVRLAGGIMPARGAAALSDRCAPCCRPAALRPVARPVTMRAVAMVAVLLLDTEFRRRGRGIASGLCACLRSMLRSLGYPLYTRSRRRLHVSIDRRAKPKSHPVSGHTAVLSTSNE